MNNPERVEAVAEIRWEGSSFGGQLGVRLLKSNPENCPPGTKLYTPAAVAALLRGMVPPKVNELLPEDQAYNAALADVRDNIARWEAEGKV